MNNTQNIGNINNSKIGDITAGDSVKNDFQEASKSLENRVHNLEQELKKLKLENRKNKIFKGIKPFFNNWFIVILLLILIGADIYTRINVINIESDYTGIILVFIGILATFIVVGNYAQVKDIEKKFNDNLQIAKEETQRSYNQVKDIEQQFNDNVLKAKEEAKNAYDDKFRYHENVSEMRFYLLDSYIAYNANENARAMMSAFIALDIGNINKDIPEVLKNDANAFVFQVVWSCREKISISERYKNFCISILKDSQSNDKEIIHECLNKMFISKKTSDIRDFSK